MISPWVEGSGVGNVAVFERRVFGAGQKRPPSFLPVPEVGDDAGVIEAEMFGKSIQRIEGGIFGIVACKERFGMIAVPHEYGGERMAAHVAQGPGIHAENAFQNDVESRLFLHFTYGGVFGAFAFLDESAGKGHAERRILAADENDAERIVMDDDVGGGQGIAVADHERAAGRAVAGMIHA